MKKQATKKAAKKAAKKKAAKRAAAPKASRRSVAAPENEEVIEVWHKKTCSKSCEVMNVLKTEGVHPSVFEYSVTPPTEKQLRELLKKLGIPAEALVRKKEPVYKEKYEGKKMTEAQWIKAMVQDPILIERPVIIRGNKAVIGRPTERIYEIINE